MPPYHGNPASIVAFTSPLVIVAKSSFPSMIQLSSVAGGSKVQFSSEIQAFLVALGSQTVPAVCFNDYQFVSSLKDQSILF